MTVSLSDFRGSFPEFDSASDDLVEAKLAEATAAIDAGLWGADERVKYLTAHLVETSPSGYEMRKANGGRSTYLAEFERLTGIAAVDRRVY